MRIIAGSRKGFKLKLPPGAGARPVTDRIKESVFGLLSVKLPQAMVLDLFAGAGSFGIEALSRGARGAVFVDSSPECRLAMEENLRRTGMRGEVICGRIPGAIEALSGRGGVFDLVFVDPPFKSAGEDIKKALAVVCGSGLLAKGAILAMRFHFKTVLPAPPPGVKRFREKKYGENRVVFCEFRGHER